MSAKNTPKKNRKSGGASKSSGTPKNATFSNGTGSYQVLHTNNTAPKSVESGAINAYGSSSLKSFTSDDDINLVSQYIDGYPAKLYEDIKLEWIKDHDVKFIGVELDPRSSGSGSGSISGSGSKGLVITLVGCSTLSIAESIGHKILLSFKSEATPVFLWARPQTNAGNTSKFTSPEFYCYRKKNGEREVFLSSVSASKVNTLYDSKSSHQVTLLYYGDSEKSVNPIKEMRRLNFEESTTIAIGPGYLKLDKKSPLHDIFPESGPFLKVKTRSGGTHHSIFSINALDKIPKSVFRANINSQRHFSSGSATSSGSAISYSDTSANWSNSKNSSRGCLSITLWLLFFLAIGIAFAFLQPPKHADPFEHYQQLALRFYESAKIRGEQLVYEIRNFDCNRSLDSKKFYESILAHSKDLYAVYWPVLMNYYALVREYLLNLYEKSVLQPQTAETSPLNATLISNVTAVQTEAPKNIFVYCAEPVKDMFRWLFEAVMGIFH